METTIKTVATGCSVATATIRGRQIHYGLMHVDRSLLAASLWVVGVWEGVIATTDRYPHPLRKTRILSGKKGNRKRASEVDQRVQRGTLAARQGVVEHIVMKEK